MEPRLEHQTIKIRQLIDDFQSGRIVIPEFQRGYVWSPSKAPKLIDSLFQDFPIASLLLWQSAEIVRPRSNESQLGRSRSFSWLIDGQQRVYTLAHVKDGDEGLNVVFNPDTSEFRLANAATKRDRRWLRVAEIWDDEQYRQIRKGFDSDPRGRAGEARIDRVRRILDYEVPVVRMIDHTFKDAVSAFQRINTLGTRLKETDIESAQIAAVHTGFIADEVIPFLHKLRTSGFTRINIMHLFKACEFIAKPDGRDRKLLHEMSKKEVESAWRKTQRATQVAIGLVRSELGLINMDILWSGSILVPVIAMCATQGPKELNARGVGGWIALAALSRRYSGSSKTALEQDLRACRSGDPLGALISNIRQTRQLKARPEDFSGSLANKSGLLAMYLACRHKGLLDFYQKGNIVLQDNVDRHHILPRAQFPENQRVSSDCIANLAFISGPTNKALGLTGPDVYLPKIGSEILESQCIPQNKDLWRIDKADSFWAMRKRLLAKSFNCFIRETLPNRKL